MKRREIKEKVTKEFLLALMAPYLPTLKKDEKITDIALVSDLETIEFIYVVIREESEKKG